MARTEWLSDEELPQLDAHLAQLERFTDALSDGVIDSAELASQEAALARAMKAVEDKLDDEQHALVTTLLVELTAYNIMGTLHGLAAERMGEKFGA